MTYFCTLASGSEGNCYIYVNGRQRILIDAGKNTRYINDCLRQLALSVSDLTHILITHSHADHVSALPVLLKHTRAALVCSSETFSAIGRKLPFGVPVQLFEPGEGFWLGQVPVKTFATSHDVPGSCGFVLGQGMLMSRMSDESRKRLLYTRYLDDWGYQANVRQNLSATLGYFKGQGSGGNLNEKRAQTEASATLRMQTFAGWNLPKFVDVKQIKVTMPWNRLFECYPQF